MKLIRVIGHSGVCLSQNQLKLSGRKIEFRKSRPHVMDHYQFPFNNSIGENGICIA